MAPPFKIFDPVTHEMVSLNSKQGKAALEYYKHDPKARSQLKKSLSAASQQYYKK